MKMIPSEIHWQYYQFLSGHQCKTYKKLNGNCGKLWKTCYASDLSVERMTKKTTKKIPSIVTECLGYVSSVAPYGAY